MANGQPVTSKQERGLSGPGILWSANRLRKPDIFNWDAFLHWYDTKVIPHCIGLSGFRSAFRAVSNEYGSERPNVVVLVVDDLAFFDSDEFKAIPFHTEEPMPGIGSIFETVDFENRWYHLMDVYDHAKTPLSATKSILSVSWDIKGDVTEDFVDNWWKKHHCEQLSQIPGFLKTTRFRLRDTWWSAGDGATLPSMDFLEIVEFDTPDIDVMAVLEHADNSDEGREAQDKIMESCSLEFLTFSMENRWGDDVMFRSS